MPLTSDIQPPFDPSNADGITSYQLLQLVSGLSPVRDKGFIVTTTDANGIVVPDAVTNNKWKNYIWRRVGADNNIYLYTWNESLALNNIMQKWQPVNLTGIPLNTITNAMLAGGITQDKIVSLLWSQLSAVPAATGQVYGTYPNLGVAVQSILGGGASGQIVAKTITAAEIADNTITAAKLANQAVDPTNTTVFKPGANLTILSSDGTAGVWRTLASMLVLREFTSAQIALVAAGSGAIPHGLTTTPSKLRGVFVCQAGGDIGFAAGSELDMYSVFFGSAGLTGPIVSVYVDNTNITYQFSSNAVTFVPFTFIPGTGVNTPMNPVQWKLKFYASL